MTCRKKCKQIAEEICDDDLCDFEIPANCITVGTLDCIDIDEDDLQSVLEEICTLISDATSEITDCCQVNTYTIDEICGEVGEDSIVLQITVTPNFSKTTPTYIDTSIDGVIRTALKDVITTITEGESFTFSTTLVGTTTDTVNVLLIDNNGNYSDTLEVDFSSLTPC